MRWPLLVLVVSAVLPAPVSGGLSPDDFERFRQAVVRVTVSGTTSGGDCENVGTAFFIDERGHLLTAGHTLLPCGSNPLGPGRWTSGPRIRVTRVTGSGAALDEAAAVVIYEDHQVDLALLRAAASIDPSAVPASARPDTLRTNDRVSLLTFQQGLTEPAEREVNIDSLFNPSDRHDGLIDISGVDVHPSASGSPLLDTHADVAGILTKGEGSTGEAVVPISFAAPLLHMAGLSYPAGEVWEAIEELRTDLVDFQFDYDRGTGNVTVGYKKRLTAGARPTRFHAVFRVYTREPGIFTGGTRYAFEHPETVNARGSRSKQGLVVFGGVGEAIDETIESMNTANRDTNGWEDLGEKAYAEVTLEVEFAGGISITPVIDRRMEFE